MVARCCTARSTTASASTPLLPCLGLAPFSPLRLHTASRSRSHSPSSPVAHDSSVNSATTRRTLRKKPTLISVSPSIQPRSPRSFRTICGGCIARAVDRQPSPARSVPRAGDALILRASAHERRRCAGPRRRAGPTEPGRAQRRPVVRSLPASRNLTSARVRLGLLFLPPFHPIPPTSHPRSRRSR